MTTLIPDDPISAPKDDQFGRERLAQSLASIIDNAPDGQSLRIGIYGDWGEGKTSVLRLVEHFLKERSHIAVWLAPWMGKETEDVWVALIDQLTIKADVNAQAFRESQAGANQLASIRKIASDSHWGLKAINGIIGDRLQRSADEQASEQRAKFLERLFDALGGRKVVVFVDDLDRTDPAIIPNLLMSLKDLFAFPGFFFVLALSPKVVEEGLRSIGFGGEHPILFLEKIVELPIYLPALDERAVDRFIDRGIADIATDVRADILRELSGFLPRNPRRIKLFLRYLASLKGEFSRFSEEEIHWRALYLAQMLRLEFPEEARKLVADSKALDDIAFSVLQERAQSLAGIKKDPSESLPEGTYASDDDRGRRFLAICAALRESSRYMSSPYSLRDLFQIVDDPPAITWGEFHSFFDEFLETSAGHRLDHIRKWLLHRGGIQIDASRIPASFTLAIDFRDAILDHGTDSTLASDVAESVEAATACAELIRALTIELGFLSDRSLSAENWEYLFQHLQKWSRLSRQQEYHAIRERERQLLREVASATPSETQMELLGSDVFRAAHRVGGETAAWIRATRDVEKQFAAHAIELLLERFRVPDGIEGLRDTTLGKARARYLYDLESPFYSKASRRQLRQIASLAANDPHVQKNFYVFFRVIADSALGEHWGESSLSRQSALALLDDRALVRLVWKAALRRKLNARMVGTLRAYRDALLKRGTIQERDVPLPSWWKSLERTFFVESKTPAD